MIRIVKSSLTHRAQIIEEYLASAEKRVAKIPIWSLPDEVHRHEQTNHFNEILFYVSPSSIQAIDELEEKLNAKRLDSVERTFKEVIECLVKEPPRQFE